MFDFTERDREILNNAPELGSFEVIITDHLSITISKEAHDLIEYLRANGIEYGDPRIEWCG